MKILLAVDGSEFTRRMLDYLASHPDMFGAGIEFTALTVSAPITPGALSMLPKEFVRSYYSDAAREVLDPVQSFFTEHGWTLKTEARVGHASDVITEVAASGQFDMVVMGSHGRTGLMKVVIGSVVSQVLARSGVAVLIVR